MNKRAAMRLLREVADSFEQQALTVRNLPGLDAEKAAMRSRDLARAINWALSELEMRPDTNGG